MHTLILHPGIYRKPRSIFAELKPGGIVFGAGVTWMEDPHPI